jgi:phospholipid/cholesterol/gamma-HCH transport system permease protein
VNAPVARRVATLGERALDIVSAFGDFGVLAGRTGRALVRRRFPLRDTLAQFESAIVRSTSIVVITALFTGMVLALQTAVSLGRFGAKPYTGSFVGLALVLELGPVLTALMVSGRVGAGITAEIGSMAVTEQVDAIRAMGADPIQKLVLPRVISLTLGVPILAVLASFLGIFGGLVIASRYGISASFYLQTVTSTVTLDDFLMGFVKTFWFGWTIAMVGCHMGLTTTGGTVGVGRATTRAVVVASIAIFVSDYFLSQAMMLL